MRRTGHTLGEQFLLALSLTEPTVSTVPTLAPAPTPATDSFATTLRRWLITVMLMLIFGGVVFGITWFKFHVPVPPVPPVPPISLPAVVNGHVGRIINVEATTEGTPVKWQVLSGPDTPDTMVHDDHTLHFTTPTPGDYRVQAITILSSKIETAETHVLIDSGPNPPPPPVPPVPPPPPPPPPNPPPIPSAGFRVLMVYDVTALSKMPKDQLDILYSTQMRDWLSSKCVKGADGKTPEWRLWDKDEDASHEAQLWQDAMKRDRKALPWLVVSNGKTGWEGPLPASVNETIALLAKYAE